MARYVQQCVRIIVNEEAEGFLNSSIESSEQRSPSGADEFVYAVIGRSRSLISMRSPPIFKTVLGGGRGMYEKDVMYSGKQPSP